MFELSGAGDDAVAKGKVFFDSAQTACIRDHLALVFLHEIDPSMGPPEHQAKLDKAHNKELESLKADVKALKHDSYSSGVGPVMRC